MGERGSQLEGSVRVGDLISISRAPAVVSLRDVETLRGKLRAGESCGEQFEELLGGYHLGDPDARAAFDTVVRSLGRPEQRGDAFIVQGVCGAGKSHLLAVLALLCGHPQEAWPAFLSSHSQHERASAAFARPRLVVTIALDEYPPGSHSLEGIVLSALEEELARGHGVRVALTEDSHLLALVDRYVFPQATDGLEQAARAKAGKDWQTLREEAPEQAAQAALAFIEQTGFPLDWRRSRAEAWGVLRRTLDEHGIDGPVVLLDELGMFLAGKGRRALNADASFLQYLAQRTATERCWLVCVTQRGLEDVGDIDRRTLRQMRDRFRPPLTLDLSELGWIVEHRLVVTRDEQALRALARQLYDELGGDGLLTPEEIARCYPINPLCLSALQRAAEMHLSRTRSVVRVLQEAAHERGWLEQPARRLITPDVVFDLVREEIADSPAGQRHLWACELVEANAGRILPGREPQLLAAVKTLVLLGLAGLKWSAEEIRTGLLGCQEESLWREPAAAEEALRALYRWGAGVERTRAEPGDSFSYFLDISSDASERIRQRINELVAGFGDGDSRVARAGLAACHEPLFPLAGFEEPRTLGVDWWNARRYVAVLCRDLAALTREEVQNLLGVLESPETKEDGRLLIALPTREAEKQETAWQAMGAEADGRFSPAVLAWFPRALTENEWGLLAEHAALAQMVGDRTFAGRREAELRQKLRDRWLDSEASAREIVRHAYYQGRIVGLKGTVAVEPERMAGMAGGWEEALAAAFAGAFRTLFPRFPSVAPERKLAGRAQTNQIIDQFIRPAQVCLPPASALEAHLRAYAAPLGLVEGEGGELRLALANLDLVAAAIAAAPAHSGREEVSPEEAIRFGELAGKLAKSEWGLVREQGELLVAALIRTGHLVALDAFLQPTRLHVIAAPLAENLPYVMRGRALTGAAAAAARALWTAATGGRVREWDLPTQEQAWGEMIAWSSRLRGEAADRRLAIACAAETFGHAALRNGEAPSRRAAELRSPAGPEALPKEASLRSASQPERWAFALAALGVAEVVAQALDAARTSRDGLAGLAEAVGQLPGGVTGATKDLATWRDCEQFLDHHLAGLAAAYRLLSDQRVRCPDGSLLARQRAEALKAFSSPERLVSELPTAISLAHKWLEAYRKHYLAWHAQVHAAGRFEPLARVRRSEAMEAARRLGAAGVRTEEVDMLDAGLAGALARRCLVGDALPAGSVVCPSCGIGLGQELPLPKTEEVERQTGELLQGQMEELRGHDALLRRRLEGRTEERVREAVGRWLEAAATSRAGACLLPHDILTDEAASWIQQQLGQPRAKKRELGDLEKSLRGKEMPKREVMRTVEQWLGEGEDEMVEIV